MATPDQEISLVINTTVDERALSESTKVTEAAFEKSSLKTSQAYSEAMIQSIQTTELAFVKSSQAASAAYVSAFNAASLETETALIKSAETSSTGFVRTFNETITKSLAQPVKDSVRSSVEESLTNPISAAIKAKIASAFTPIGDTIGDAISARIKSSTIFAALEDLSKSVVYFIENLSFSNIIKIISLKEFKLVEVLLSQLISTLIYQVFPPEFAAVFEAIFGQVKQKSLNFFKELEGVFDGGTAGFEIFGDKAAKFLLKPLALLTKGFTGGNFIETIAKIGLAVEKFVTKIIKGIDSLVESANRLLFLQKVIVGFAKAGSLIYLILNFQKLFAILSQYGIIKFATGFLAAFIKLISNVTPIGRFTDSLSKSSSVFKTFISQALVPSQANLLALSEIGLILGGSLKVVAAGFLSINQVGPALLFNEIGAAAQFAGIAIFLALRSVADAVTELGTFIVDFSTSTTKAFSDSEKSTILLTRSINNINSAFGQAAGSGEEWLEIINQTSAQTGIAADQLQKAASEIIFVGAQLGLTKFELQQLFAAAVDFSTVSGDVIQSSIDLVSALNGSSQSVIKYGIKLSETNLQQFALKKGINRSIASLSEQDKVLLRASKIFSTYGLVQGQATALSNSFSGSVQRLETTLKRASSEIGKGAAVIEGWNLAAFTAEKTLGVIPDTLLNLVGLVGAFTGRLLQLIGILSKLAISTALVVTSFKILNTVLKTNIAQSLIAKISNDQLRLSFLLLGKNITSASEAGSVFARSFKLIIASITGANASTTGFKFVIEALKSAATRLGNVFKFVFGAIAGIVGLTGIKLAAVLTTIVVVVGSVSKALSVINQKTGALTELWKIMIEVFTISSPLLQGLKAIFEGIAEAVVKKLAQAIGVLVFIFVTLLDVVTRLATTKIFSKLFTPDQVQRLGEVNSKLSEFRDNLVDAGLDFRKVADDAKRGIASAGDPLDRLGAESELVFKEFIENNKAFLIENKALFIQYATDLNAISQAQSDALLRLTYTSAEQRRNVLDQSLEETKRRQQEILDLQNAFQTGLGDSFKGAFEAVGASFVIGQKAFKNFGKSILGTLGDLAIKAGFVISGMGEALTVLAAALTNPFTGPAAIIAGIALIALGGALKALSGGKGGIGGATPVSSTNSLGSPINTSGTGTEGVQDIQERGPSVQLIVQGNILDRRQTGLELAEVIREAVGKGAVVYS